MALMAFFFVALLSIVCSGSCALESVPDLEKVMYKVIDGTPCIRLLNIYGEFGCANPGRTKVIAPIRRLTTLEIPTSEPVTALVPYSIFHLFLEKANIDSSFGERVAGVLLEFQENSNITTDANPDKKFPQAEFAPYSKKDYVWNPSGTGVLHRRYNFPVYLLSWERTKLLQEVAAENEARKAKYPVNVAEFDIVMQTTKSDTHTTEECLKEWSCLPLGGYSVLSTLSPMETTFSSKPIVLVMAAMDSASFFRDFTPGADSSISGLIALLAAVDALAKVEEFKSKMNKQVVFLVCNGEAWGYLGSRRFLHELEFSGESVAGLNISNIYQVLEAGSVGRIVENTLYAHSSDMKATKEILDALQTSAESFGVKVKPASSQNPGIPPSSLMPFLLKNASISGVVLEEFDTSFKNSFYHSHFDTAGNVNAASIATASRVLARTIHQLCTVDDSSSLELINVNMSLVEELISCLLTPYPGMNCELVKGFVSPSQAFANHYVGVLQEPPSGSSPSSDTLDDTTQFVWNFLADRTRSKMSTKMSCSGSCKDKSLVCVGATSEHKGICVNSTTRYVPAYSTRLEYKSGWKVLPVEAGDLMNSIDPVWTESFWGNDLRLRVYLKGDTSTDRLILVTGLSITVASVIAILGTQAIFKRRLKNA